MTPSRHFTRALTAGALGLGLLLASGCSTNDANAILTSYVSTANSLSAQLDATRSPNVPDDAGLYRLRMCESHGNYQAVSSGGTYRGAYQFSRSTWNNVARSVLPSYLNTDPAAAEPVVQDAFARALWANTGWHSWPVCGRRV